MAFLSVPRTPRLPYSVGQVVTELKLRVSDFLKYRALLSELRALSPRERNDIGLRADELKAVARQSIYGRAH